MTASAITGLATLTSRLAKYWLSICFTLWYPHQPSLQVRRSNVTLGVAALLIATPVLASPSVEIVRETSSCARDTAISEQQCEALGGRLETIPSTGQAYCNLPTRDADNTCQTSADCESYCMAESLTCFGYRMMPPGCHAYVHEDGSTIEICFD